MTDNSVPGPTLVETTAKFLRDAILRGEYPPGVSLPEIPLSKELNVSRGAVREALRTLSETGLVVLSPRHGAEVCSVSPQLIHEVYTLRAVLEAFAVKLAITSGHMNGEALRGVEATYEGLVAAVESDDKAAMIEADMAFHCAVCSPCGHELLLEHLRQLQARTCLCILYTKVHASDAESEALSHRPILNAVISGEADRAEAALRDHLISAGQRLLVRMTSSESLRGRRTKKRTP